jgi:flagellar motility protein MotE (MotC chaperone)
VVPKLFAERGGDETVRVWVPGCSTGEEAFSIAILLREHMGQLTAVPRVQLFATDIDERGLAVARRALSYGFARQRLVEEYETALEELKSSNEELVSVNEEMQSANEELEASKEELQSLNEELHTVNTELSDRVEASIGPRATFRTCSKARMSPLFSSSRIS